MHSRHGVIRRCTIDFEVNDGVVVGVAGIQSTCSFMHKQQENDDDNEFIN